MANQYALDKVYMQTAVLHSELSHALRKQVGAVLVTSQGVTLTGYNGTPTGCNNACEHCIGSEETGYELVTKAEVIHAELNCIMKAAREGVSVLGATLYVTLSPCIQCSAMLIQVGVKRVVYKERYKDTTGITLLQSAGVKVDDYGQY